MFPQPSNIQKQTNKKNKFFYLIQVWAFIVMSVTSMKRFCSVQIFPRWNSLDSFLPGRLFYVDLLYIPHTTHTLLQTKVCVWLQGGPLLLSLHGNPCTWWRTTMRCETPMVSMGRFLWRHQPSAPV